MLFSYNITSPTKKLLRSLNRERTNVGRSAYTDRIKSILLESSSTEIAEILVMDLEKIQRGIAHDELQWIDVQVHACKILNSKEKVLFLTNDEIMSSGGKYVSYAQYEGRKIITIPETLANKIQDTKDEKGEAMVDLDLYIKEWNENFEFEFIKETDLTKREKEIFSYKDNIFKWLGYKGKKDIKVMISETMSPDSYTGQDAAGLWIENENKIVINRNQLQDIQKFTGTFIHELIHAYTSTDDQTIAFENELTDSLGKLSKIIIDSNGEKKKEKKIFGFF